MKINIDSDVEKVMEFKALNIKRQKLVFVAKSIAQLAELAWSDAVLCQQAINAIEISERSRTLIERLQD